MIFSARTCSSAAVGVNKYCSDAGACERKYIEDTATADACLELCRQQPLCLNWVGLPANKLYLKLYFITSNRFGTMRTLGVGRGNAGLLRNQKMASRNLTMTIVSADLVKVIVEQLNA